MKLTLINQYYPPDFAPTGHLAASLAEHRAEFGDDVTVITSAGGYASADTSPEPIEKPRTRVIRLRTLELGRGSLARQALDYSAFYAGALWQMSHLPAQDVVIALTTPPWIGWAGWLHKWRHPGSKLVIWIMDAYPEAAERFGTVKPGSAISRVARTVSKGLLTRADGVVALDSAMKDLLTSHYALEQTGPPVTVISNWEPPTSFSTNRMADGWSPPPEIEEQFTVLYLGNAGRGHDFATALDAAHQLHEESVAFLFVGGGPQWERLKEARNTLDLQNLHLLDYVPRELLASVMTQADCGLIVMRDDALGVISPSKLHGYLAMGLPVIYVGPEGSNVDEAIRKFGLGVSLRHGDRAGLVAFIRKLSLDPDYKDGLSQNAKVAFKTDYSDSAALPKFDRLLNELAQPQ